MMMFITFSISLLICMGCNPFPNTEAFDDRPSYRETLDAAPARAIHNHLNLYAQVEQLSPDDSAVEDGTISIVETEDDTAKENVKSGEKFKSGSEATAHLAETQAQGRSQIFVLSRSNPRSAHAASSAYAASSKDKRRKTLTKIKGGVLVRKQQRRDYAHFEAWGDGQNMEQNEEHRRFLKDISTSGHGGPAQDNSDPAVTSDKDDVRSPAKVKKTGKDKKRKVWIPERIPFLGYNG